MRKVINDKSQHFTFQYKILVTRLNLFPFVNRWKFHISLGQNFSRKEFPYIYFCLSLGMLQNLKCSFSQTVGAQHACKDPDEVVTSCSCYPSCTSWYLLDSHTCKCECKVNATMLVEGYFKTGAICCKLEASLSSL